MKSRKETVIKAAKNLHDLCLDGPQEHDLNIDDFDNCPCCGREREIRGTITWDDITCEMMSDVYHACDMCYNFCYCEGRPHIPVNMDNV